jgi:tRNA (guanine-N7-)-methyltransferase
MTRSGDGHRSSDVAVLGPGIRTFKPRRSRITQRQLAALGERRWLIGPADTPLDIASLWGAGTPVVMEIGFGTGEATARLAGDFPSTGILAIDIHTPGVGNLLDLLARGGLTNVRVMEADALMVLSRMIPPLSLAGVRTYFPDPWPKARHNKRRIIQAPVLDLVASRLQPGGFWHVATDWDAYVVSIEEVFAAHDGWVGGRIPRPEWRPETRYERRALREGRAITDLMFRMLSSAGVPESAHGG